MLSVNDFANRQTSDEEPYDQYELSVPLQNVSACLKKVCALHAYWHYLICVEACAHPGLIIFERYPARCPGSMLVRSHRIGGPASVTMSL